MRARDMHRLKHGTKLKVKLLPWLGIIRDLSWNGKTVYPHGLGGSNWECFRSSKRVRNTTKYVYLRAKEISLVKD